MPFFKLFLLLVLEITLFSQTYSFTELRYSDAIGRYSKVDGIIEFKKNGLKIIYPIEKKELDYDGKSIVFLSKGQKLPLPSEQERYMMYYFEILKLLHSGNEKELKENFTVEKKASHTVLIPNGMLSYYLDFIELTEKDLSKLDYVKLFFKNKDTISIHIDDEIH